LPSATRHPEHSTCAPIWQPIIAVPISAVSGGIPVAQAVIPMQKAPRPELGIWRRRIHVFANGTTTKWLENSRQMTHPAGSGKRTGYDKRWPIRNEMAACTVQPMQNGQLLLYVGGEMYLYQNCYRKRHGSDPIPVWSAPIHAWGWVTFNIQRVMISFY